MVDLHSNTDLEIDDSEIEVMSMPMGNGRSIVQTLLQDLGLIRVILSGMDWILIQ